MKLAHVLSAAVLCAAAARAGDESLLPLRTWNTDYLFVVKVASADFDGNGRKEVVTISSDEPGSTMEVFSLGPHGDMLSQLHLPAAATGDTAAADFDGDGLEDLAIASGTVRVYRGGIDGMPTLWKSIVVSTFSLVSLVVADFDGDTWPDILVCEGTTTNKPFRILRNVDGTGFQDLTAVSGSGMFPEDLALADLDGNGTLDVLASERTADDVRVLLAAPGGLAFANHATLPMSDMPQDIRAVDLTGDGLTDIAVAVGGTATGVTCRAGTGGGDFGPASNTPAAGSWPILDAGDIDGDGDTDLVVGSTGHYTWGFLNAQGALPLAAPQTLHTMADAPTVMMTDVNGDGWSDLVAGPASASSIVLSFGGPQGLQLSRSSPLTTDPVTLHAADVTGDGQPDLVSLGGNGTWLSVVDGHGDGTFGTPVNTFVPPGGTGQQTTLGLCNDDGLLDVVILSTLTGPGLRLRVATSNGASKTFTMAAPTTTAESAAAGPLAADLDGDGEVEICLPTTMGVVEVWHVGASSQLVSAGGYPVPEVFTDFAAWDRSTAGDLDEDGFLDLVFPIVELQRVFVMPGQAGGGLGAATILDDGPATLVNCAFVVDIDEDGLNDIVGTGLNYTTTVWQGQAGMAFGAPQSATGGPRTSQCIDLDGDGHLDLVGSLGIAGTTLPHDLLVQRGLGNGQFLPALHFGSVSSRLAVADFTSDGVPDVVASGDVVGGIAPLDAEDPQLYVTHPYTQFTDLGHALGGSHGEPQFLAWAWLKPAQLGHLSVARAAPAVPAAMFVGLQQLLLPFKGGTLVPSVDIFLPGFVTDGEGRIQVGMTWPSGVPAGLEMSMQWWFADASGPSGFTASNALTAATP